MKFKRMIILLLIIFFITSINVKCFAKYVFEYTKKAAEITVINN